MPPQDIVPPQDILYSLPTLCDQLPTVDPGAADADRLALHEDDWRQVELISAGLNEVVATELAAIRHIYEKQAVTASDGNITGFRSLHLRTSPTAPLAPPPPAAALHLALPAEHTYAGIGFADAPGVAVDSFGFTYGPFDIYGLITEGTVTVLALQLSRPPTGTGDASAALAALMRRHTLVLVDWCQCALIDADALDAYLPAKPDNHSSVR